MSIVILVFIAILGALVGSFLNVVILRLNTGRGLGGRSQCFSCQTTLRWFELIPIASFFMLRGRCRTCSSKISKRYVLVELLTALVFFGIGFQYINLVLVAPIIWMTVVFLFVIMSLLIVISVYDIRHTIVPDMLVIPFIILSFVTIFFTDYQSPLILGTTFSMPSLSVFLAGIIIPLPFFLLWLISKGKLMGFGDIKIMMGIGWLAGLASGITAVIVSFWIGALVSVIVLGFQKLFSLFRKTKRPIIKKEIPFAPFLAIGLYVVMIFHFNLFAIPLF